MFRHSSAWPTVVLGLCIVGCGLATPPAPPSTSGPPMPTTPAEGGWVTFEFPGAGFTVECPAPPTQDRFNEQFARPDEPTSTIYRASGKGFDVGVILGTMITPTIAEEIELEKKGTPQNFPGSTVKEITQAGLPGVEISMPARGSTASTTERHLYRDGKVITLQFTLLKTGDANAAAADRERFFNSFKLK